MMKTEKIWLITDNEGRIIEENGLGWEIPKHTFSFSKKDVKEEMVKIKRSYRNCSHTKFEDWGFHIRQYKLVLDYPRNT